MGDKSKWETKVTHQNTRIATLLSMIPVTLPWTTQHRFLCFFFNYQQIHPGLGLLLVLDFDRSNKIVKKLKLTGVPHKIFKIATFIKDMLSGALEVAKVGGVNV